MRAVIFAGFVAAVVFSGAARAEDDVGELNPNVLDTHHWIGKAADSKIDPHLCAYGVFMDKTGQHEEAQRIFKRCAEAGNPYAMPWMSFMEENGYDHPSDPVAAAEWDKKLADRGSTLGKFNYGLDLLRGHGVTRDQAQGKALVDAAAAGGDKTAQDLISHHYDPDSVTPSADYAHYHQPEY